MPSSSSSASAAADEEAASRPISSLYPARFRRFLQPLDDGSLTPAEVVGIGARRTKIVCTIGPSTSSSSQLLKLAAQGMNVARLNMSHGDYSFHSEVISRVRQINTESPFVVAVMLDVGSLDTVRLGEFRGRDATLRTGDEFTITTRHEARYPPGVSEVSNDGFLEVVTGGDVIEVKGVDGMLLLRVTEVGDTDAKCAVMEGGVVGDRAPITIRGKSLRAGREIGGGSGDGGDENGREGASESVAMGMRELEFAVHERVEAVALSFVEDPEQIRGVKQMLRKRGSGNTAVVAKIESAGALERLDGIIEAADAVMIARGDLGTAIRYEMVPYWQQRIVQMCRKHGKPCIVSTHFLESMVLYPTPTRAEVTDICEAVKQRVDALMLTAETASGKYPLRALAVMGAVVRRTEFKLSERLGGSFSSLGSYIASPSAPSFGEAGGNGSNGSNGGNGAAAGGAELLPPLAAPRMWARGVSLVAERVCSTAANIAHQLDVAAIVCFTQRGFMASLLSRCRPWCRVFAFTNSVTARNRMSLLYGVRPFRILFDGDSEVTVQRAIDELRDRGALQSGDRVVLVADVLGGSNRATEEEMLLVFGQLDRAGRGLISRELLRRGLRELGLKAGDDIELETWLDEYDQGQAVVEECISAEDPELCAVREEADGVSGGSAGGGEGNDARSPSAVGTKRRQRERRLAEEIDYPTFRQIVQDAAEIVQTIQARVIE